MRRLIGVPVRGTLLVCVLLVVAGCAQFEVAERTMSCNLAVESATNRLLLLNAVRASKRYPMHFAAITIVRGDVPLTAELGFAIPFGGASVDNYTFSPKITTKSGTSFELGILNKQDFYRGILSPLSAKTLHYYFNQGWPEEILIHMFVREIRFDKAALDSSIIQRIRNAFEAECTKTADELCTVARRTSLAGVECRREMEQEDDEKQSYVNEPGSMCRFLRFQNMIHKLRIIGLDLEKSTVTRQVPTKVVTETIASNEIRVKTELEVKTTDDYSFTFKIPSERSPKEKETPRLLVTEAQRTVPERQDLSGAVLLRSPEAMIFYMGELVEVQNRTHDPFIPKAVFGPRGDRAERALFRVQKRGVLASGTVLCVDHENETYCIPRVMDPRRMDQSMHTLSLVSQILAQQQTAQDLPVTPAVRIIGQ